MSHEESNVLAKRWKDHSSQPRTQPPVGNAGSPPQPPSRAIYRHANGNTTVGIACSYSALLEMVPHDCTGQTSVLTLIPHTVRIGYSPRVRPIRDGDVVDAIGLDSRARTARRPFTITLALSARAPRGDGGGADLLLPVMASLAGDRSAVDGACAQTGHSAWRAPPSRSSGSRPLRRRL